MKIRNIRLQNYRCFEDITIDFNCGTSVVIGNNGVGKSTVLDAVAIGIGSLFLGIESSSAPEIKAKDVRSITREIGSSADKQPQYPTIISCIGEIDNEEINWVRQLNTEKGKTSGEVRKIKNIASDWQKKIREGDASINLPIISYYRTSRLWKQTSKYSTKQMQNRFSGYTDCLSTESNEKIMLRWFEKMTYIQLQNGESVPELEAVKKAVAECYIESGAKASNVKVSFNVKFQQLEISYTDENNNLQVHPFRELSDGYKNTLSLVADIAYRMAILNPQLLDEVIKKTEGIVLIDEIDLHLHPIWQKTILKTLQKIFPLVQFIVTTHSPSVISSAKAENLLILNGNSCKSFDYEVFGKDVNSILSEVMETSERPDEISDMFNEFDEYLENGDFKAAEDKLNELRNLLGENDNGVVRATVALDFEKDWED